MGFLKHLAEGRIPALTDSSSSSEVLISGRLSAMLGVGVRDVVTMYFIGENVRMRRFIVSGIYDAQLEDIDNHLVMETYVTRNV